MNTNINKSALAMVALVRALYPRNGSPVTHALGKIDGRLRATARLEVVFIDPVVGCAVFSEVHLGLRNQFGRMDNASFKHKDMERFGAYVHMTARRSVIRGPGSLGEWQEKDLVYAARQLENGRHDEPQEIYIPWFIDMNERELVRHGKGAKVSTESWMPRLHGKRDKRGHVVKGSPLDQILDGFKAADMKVTSATTDVELIEIGGGNVDKGLLPPVLVEEYPGSAVVVDLTAYAEWTAVTVESLEKLGGYLPLKAYQEREAETAKRIEARSQNRGGAPTGNSEELAPTDAAEATEAEAQVEGPKKGRGRKGSMKLGRAKGSPTGHLEAIPSDAVNPEAPAGEPAEISEAVASDQAASAAELETTGA